MTLNGFQHRIGHAARQLQQVRGDSRKAWERMKSTIDAGRALEVIKQCSVCLFGHIKERSVAIICLDNDGNPKEQGSGTCITVDDRHFIATAAHVILPYPHENLRIAPGGLSLSIQGRGTRGGQVPAM
jgi:hypothetical protein